MKKKKDNNSENLKTNKENNSEKIIEKENEQEFNQEKLEKIKEEIDETKKEKKNSKKNNNIRKSILRNILIAIVITVYFLFINLGVKTIPITEYILDLKTFSVFSIIIAIIIFERAYKKDANYLALHGIELIAVSIETLVLLQLYSIKSQHFYFVLFAITLGMIIYYLLKSCIICVRQKIKK